MRVVLASTLLLAGFLPAQVQGGATFTVKQLTPETALKAAQGALAACRQAGHQIAVTVVDRAGVPQVLLRDRFAGPHTVEISTNKAWTALTFRQDTTSLNAASQPGQPAAPIRQFPRVVVMGGGLPIEAGGSLLGAIAVSGAPGGDADDICAKAGLESIREDIEF
jgi:uncharacterized protein GlcG (DUF336 family)